MELPREFRSGVEGAEGGEESPGTSNRFDMLFGSLGRRREECENKGQAVGRYVVCCLGSRWIPIIQSHISFPNGAISTGSSQNGLNVESGGGCPAVDFFLLVVELQAL